MGLFSDLASRPDQPVQDVSNAPMTQEQFVQQNPNSSNPEYDYMLYQMQQQNDAKAQADAQLQQTDPKAYNAQKAQSLADDLFTSFTNNGHGFGGTSTNEAENTVALDAFKQIDPNAYYNAQLSLDLRKAGWDAGQGKTNADTNARIQSNMQDALKAGFDPNQIQNLVANNYANTAQWHATNIAQRQGQGATLGGIEKVAPAFAAMITAGALAPAAAALEAGTVAGETALGATGAGSIDAYMAGAGLDAGSFGGSAFTVPELASSSLNASSYPGADAILNAPDVQISSFGTGMPSGASGGITAPLEGSGAVPGAGATTLGEGGLTGALPANVMVGDGTLGTTIGATYASSAPGQFALDASGAAIPASSVGIGGFAPSTGLSLADILKTANQVKQGISTASTLAKLLGGSAAGSATGGAKTGGTTTGTGGLSPQDLAKYLGSIAPAQAGAVPYQIKMNQNPFTFNTPGQTQATKGMYDVSGINPMANALRTA